MADLGSGMAEEVGPSGRRDSLSYLYLLKVGLTLNMQKSSEPSG